VDIVGAPECPKAMRADVRDLSRLESGRFGAAYVGHVFECVPGRLERGLAEVYRVADEMFVAHIPPEALSAEWHPEVHQVLYSAPPTTPFVAWRNLGEDTIFVTGPDGTTRAARSLAAMLRGRRL
jgi:hypothetical protein